MTRRLDDYPNSARLTRALAADLIGCSEATIAARNYAGLLPYAPTRPITVLAGDLKILRKMLANGVSEKLIRRLRIQPQDCPTYSRLDGVQSLTYAPYDMVVDELVAATHALYAKYQKDGSLNPKKKKKKRAGNVVAFKKRSA